MRGINLRREINNWRAVRRAAGGAMRTRTPHSVASPLLLSGKGGREGGTDMLDITSAAATAPLCSRGRT